MRARTRMSFAALLLLAFCALAKRRATTAELSAEDYEFSFSLESQEVEDYFKPTLLTCDKNEGKPAGSPNCTCDTGDEPTLNCTGIVLSLAGGKMPLDTAQIQVKASDGRTSELKPSAVILARNEIETLRKEMILPGMNLSRVKHLDFSHNRIGLIESGAFDAFPSLEVLRLSQNALRSFDVDEGWLDKSLGKSLQRLYLNANELRGTLDDGIFNNLRNLTHLHLDWNPKIRLSNKVFTKELANLRVLTLEGCELDSLDDSVFENLGGLVAISLADNKFSSVPTGALAKLPNLRVLDLSNNTFEKLPALAFAPLTGLKKLLLHEMPKLNTVEGKAFCADESHIHSNLTRIDLSGSKQLAHFDAQAFCSADRSNEDKSQLTELILKGCGITTLAYGLLKPADWKQIKTLKLEGNPFACDVCGEQGLGAQWVIASASNELPAELKMGNMACQTPEKVRGFSVADAYAKLCTPQGAMTDAGTSSYFFTWMIVLLMASIMLMAGFIFSRRDRLFGGDHGSSTVAGPDGWFSDLRGAPMGFLDGGADDNGGLIVDEDGRSNTLTEGQRGGGDANYRQPDFL